MKVANIVIGANYGDEGKGLVTNAITPEDGVVVLTNGGAQRGHTVVYNGIRHVFHHFGSATLKGAASYYSEDFIVNPIKFNEEYTELCTVNVTPICYCSEKCRISTPYDMIANMLRTKETNTTGYGILETIDRYNSNTSFKTVEGFLETDETWEEELDHIRDYYIEKFKDYKDTEEYKLLLDPRLKKQFISDLYKFFNKMEAITSIIKICENFDTVTFEQGQGLALDMDEDIEYGTPTHTGSIIPFKLLSQVDIKNAEINRYYVTRSYLTRHGNGLLRNEDKTMRFEDKTNQPNQFQGSIRFAKFTRYTKLEMSLRILYDSTKARSLFRNISVKNYLVVTHMNERKPRGFLSTIKLEKIYYSYDETNISKDTD